MSTPKWIEAAAKSDAASPETEWTSADARSWWPMHHADDSAGDGQVDSAAHRSTGKQGPRMARKQETGR
jgi:hypothetical protein